MSVVGGIRQWELIKFEERFKASVAAHWLHHRALTSEISIVESLYI